MLVHIHWLVFYDSPQSVLNACLLLHSVLPALHVTCAICLEVSFLSKVTSKYCVPSLCDPLFRMSFLIGKLVLTERRDTQNFAPMYFSITNFCRFSRQYGGLIGLQNFVLEYDFFQILLQILPLLISTFLVRMQVLCVL